MTAHLWYVYLIFFIKIQLRMQAEEEELMKQDGRYD